VLNVDGEADIDDNGASAFQRLEEWIWISSPLQERVQELLKKS